MRLRHLLPALPLVLAACSDQSPPGPGTLTATLVSPNGDEGSAVVILVGTGIGDVTPSGGTEVYAQGSDAGARVVLIHPLGGVLEFQVAVADTTQKPEAIVQEVAGPNDQLRPPTAGYRVELRR